MVQPERLDEKFAPVESELLFWLGFPGSTAKRHELVTEWNTRYSWFGHLETVGIPMLTQQVQLLMLGLPYFDAEKHVLLHYPSSAIRNTGQPREELPNPEGMSGSLLWDTRFVACTFAGQEWTVEKARVCGVIWAAHSKPEVIVATKIEYVRPSLLRFLRDECAYFRWIDRGRPLWDGLVDWTWAEQEIPDLGR